MEEPDKKNPGTPQCDLDSALLIAYLEYTTKEGLYTQPFKKINILFTNT